MKRSFSIATACFFLSRLLLFLSVFVIAPRVPLHCMPPWSCEIPLLEPLFRWDTGWYLGIVTGGYRFGDPSFSQFNVAFFPLFPLLVKLLSAFLSIPAPWVGLFASNAFLWGSLFVLHRLLSEDFEPAIADGAVILLGFFPTTIFCSTMYTESLFLFLSLLAFFFLLRDRPLLFGVLGGLSTGTRITGIVLGVPAFFKLVESRKKKWLLGITLLPSGLLAYMGYLFLRFGDPLAFLHAMRAPGWERSFGIPFVEIFLGPFSSLYKLFNGGFTAACFDVWFLFLFLAAVITLFRRAPRPYFTYLAGGMALALSSNSLLSLTRYLMVFFPAYVAMSLWTRNRPFLRWGLVAAFALLSVLYSVLFSRYYWAG